MKFKTFLTILFLVSVVLSKLYLIHPLPIKAIGSAVYDDFLFVQLAKSIKEGNWLDEFNEVSHSKGPFFSIFTAFNSYTNIPLKTSEFLLYVLAVLLFYIVFKHQQKIPILPEILFVLLIFCPYVEVVRRITREGIYGSLAILILAFFYFLYFFRKKHLILNSLLSIFGGIMLFAFWYTREEGVWILPFILILSVFSIFKLYNEHQWSKTFFIRVFAYFLFIPAFFSVQQYFKLKNLKYYGEKFLLDTQTTEHKNAFEALYRVKPVNGKQPYLYLNKLTREKIYQVSPSFKKLKKPIERYKNKHGCHLYPNTCGDIANGWFFWTFRRSIRGSGYFLSPKKLRSFYNQLSDEINTACTSGALDCNEVKNVNFLHFENSDDLKRLWHSFCKGIRFLHDGCSNYTLNTVSNGSAASINLYKEITGYNDQGIILNNKVWNSNKQFKIKKQELLDKVNILKKIKHVYDKYLLKIFFYGILILLFINIYYLCRGRGHYLPFVFALGVFAIILLRILLLSIIDSTVFPGYEPRYVACLYPLISITFILLLCNPIKLWINEKGKIET